MLILFATSCSEDEVKPWQLENYIHFSGDYTNFYSFVYAGSDLEEHATVTDENGNPIVIEKDTVFFQLNTAGNFSDVDRIYKIKQVKTYDFVYEQDEYGNILDSAFIELPNQAIPDVHYVDFSKDPNQKFVVPADSLKTLFPLVVLRDPSLKANNYTLSLEIQESNDFLPGNSSLQQITLTISDQITEPVNWKDYAIGTTSVYLVMGHYGKKKHQILIDITGQKWDDDFITKELSEEYLVFYQTLAIRELERINAEREAQGLHKLREDDNNPNSEIKFSYF